MHVGEAKQKALSYYANKLKCQLTRSHIRLSAIQAQPSNETLHDVNAVVGWGLTVRDGWRLSRRVNVAWPSLF